MYDFQEFDYLPIKYKYPNENVLLIAGPENITDPNFYIDDFLFSLYNKKPLESNLLAYNSLPEMVGTLQKFYALYKTELEIINDRPVKQVKIKWPTWGELLGHTLQKSTITITKNFDNASMLDEVIETLITRRPSYAFILLQDWTIHKFFDREIAVWSNDINSSGPLAVDQLKIYNDAKLRSVPNSILSQFIEPVFRKLRSIVSLSDELDIELRIGQSQPPYANLKQNFPELWYIYQSAFITEYSSKFWFNHSKKMFGWPFCAELGGNAIVSDNINHIIPFSNSIPNAEGQQIIANKLQATL